EGLQSYAATGKIQIAERATQNIELVLKPGIVEVEHGIDTNYISISAQAYILKLNEGRITIAANATQGLYYGVQTFLQILKTQKGDLFLPQGEIRDWPDLSLRIIYWDDAHHLEKMAALKRIIEQASQYKINGFAIKLEGHFQYPHAPHIVEPYALSPAEYQELTDFAKAHFVELIPYLDAPAHISFILKHPQYAHLRLFPENNYELDMTDAGSIDLMKSMFSDLLDANQGGKYVMLSTDEAYYAGKGGREIKAAAKAGSNGKLLARFIYSIAEELHKQGRQIIFWGEYPLKPDDIPSLPPYLINGEYNEMSPAFRKHGIRQLIYTSTQGEEDVFPNYYPTHSADKEMVDENRASSGRIPSMQKDIQQPVNNKDAKPMGLIIAGWADAGLNPETFWLGYIGGTAIGWNFSGGDSTESARRFYSSFYGPAQSEMERIYELLSGQAEFFSLSWDWMPSELRKPILGNSEGIYPKPEKAKDQTLPILPVPSSTNLAISFDWDSLNRKRLESVEKFRRDNDELLDLLKANLASDQQKYNLEVLGTVAELCRQNLKFLSDLSKTNAYLKQAAKKAEANESVVAVGYIDSALALAQHIKIERDSMLSYISAIWYKEWSPLVKEANGRRFLQAVDDIKDHEPVRTIDLSYLIYRQLNYPLGKWADQVVQNRNRYAVVHSLPVIHIRINWTSYE
ncbi:MAG: glycoside hydrolase family 20 zincin-like fold domain-containing protein, partial [Chitinophagales bacterium]